MTINMTTLNVPTQGELIQLRLDAIAQQDAAWLHSQQINICKKARKMAKTIDANADLLIYFKNLPANRRELLNEWLKESGLPHFWTSIHLVIPMSFLPKSGN